MGILLLALTVWLATPLLHFALSCIEQSQTAPAPVRAVAAVLRPLVWRAIPGFFFRLS